MCIADIMKAKLRAQNPAELCDLCRSSHKPHFIQMAPLQSDWSYAGIKGIIPALLHHSLLGYNFVIPDAVGNKNKLPLFRTSLANH